MATVQDILGIIISIASVLGIFTGIINKLFNGKLEPIKQRIDEMDEDNLRENLQQYRFSVVCFASELRKGERKTRYEFESILAFVDLYEHGVERLKIHNGLFEEEVRYIKEEYRKLKGE
jgi:hypothetical protein